MSRSIRFISKSKRRLTLVGVVAVALATSIGAIAYWTTHGTGTATATVGTLNAPTGVAGSASGSTVTVTWSAPSGTPAPTGYYVTRTNGTSTVAACASSASSPLPTTPTSCSDTSVPSGTYTYNVVAVYHTWTATSAPSASVTVAALDHFVVSAPVSATAGSPFTVTVTAKDASNNTITTYSGTVHFASSDSQATAGSGLPSNYAFTTGTGNDNGVHTFTNGVILKTAGGQSVSVNDTVQTAATGTTSVTVSPASAAKVLFTQQPTSSTGGSAFPTQPKVTVKDSYGNVVTGDVSTVGLSITSGTPATGGPGTLSGCSQAETNGVITFSGCKIDAVGAAYQLHATDGSLTPDDSSTFNVTLGPAAKVKFTTQPGNGTGGSALSPQPVVTIQDAGGNTRTADTSSVTVAIGTNAGPGGVLSGTKTVAAVAGVATFSGLSIDKIGTGYTLTAADGALTGDTSSTFTVTLGPAAKVKFTTQPGNGTGGSALSPQPVVTIQDAGGNTRSADTSGVTVAIGTNAGPGGTLSGTLTVNAVAGVATFSGLSIDRIGTGYTLTAADGALTGDTSSTFNVTLGPATHLVFTTQPSANQNIQAKGTGSFQMVASVEDAGGNLVSTDTSTAVTLAILNNAGPFGTLTCTGGLGPQTVSGGMATFNGCAIDMVGTGYTLMATDATPSGGGHPYAAAMSNAFNIVTGSADASHSTLTPASSSITANGTATQVLTVQAKDANGNNLTAGGATVTITRSSGTGTIGAVTDNHDGTYTATVTAPTATGSGVFVATLGGAQVKSGTGSQTQATVTYTPGAANAAKSTLTPTSSSITANGTATQVLTVQAKDANGNNLTAGGATVTITRSSGTGTIGAVTDNHDGTYTATVTAPTATGSGVFVATLNSATVNSGNASQTQATVTYVPGAASKVVFTTPPGNGTGGAAFSTQPVVTIQDANGNIRTADTSAVTVAIGTNAGGGTLSGTKTVSAVNGVATFSGLSIDKIGTGYTLTAAASGLSGDTSSSFNVTLGPAAKVKFTTQPGNGTGGSALSSQPVVTIQDAGGNTRTSDTTAVTVAIGTNPGSGTLSGTATVNAVAGVATFSGLSIDKIGTGYTLTAAASGLSGDTSSSFNVTLGPAAKVKFTQQPSSSTGGSPFPQQPVVTIQDAGGNTRTSDTTAVTVAIGTNPGSGTLSGTATVNAVAGVATFSGLSIDKIGTGYTLTAAASGLSGDTSSAFNVTLGPAAKVKFTQQPSSSTGGSPFPQQPVVTIQDAGGNTRTPDTTAVTVAIGTNAGGGTLSGTKTVSAVNGVATFSGLSIDKIGTGYTLTAAASGLSGDTSSSFNVTLGPAAKIKFTTQPGNGTGGSALSSQPVVTIQDAGGNTRTSDTTAVTVAIGTNAGGGTLSGTKTVSAVNGVATFSGLSIDKIGTGYTLTAAASGLSGDTSSSFNVTLGPAAKVKFTTQPGNGTGGSALSSQPVVTIQDAGGNTRTSDTTAVTVAIGTNAGPGGVLAGTVTVNAVAGVATFSGLSIDKIGTGYTLTAAASGLTGDTSAAFNITVGPAASFTVSGYPSPTTAGMAHTVTVTAVDAGGNVATGYSGTVKITSSDSQAVLPANGTLTNGSGTFSLTLKTATTQSITAADTVSSSITGTQTGITVNAAAATVVAFVNCSIPTNNTGCSGQPISVGNNSNMTFNMQTQDPFGNPSAPTATVTISFGNSDPTFSISAGAPATITASSATSGQVTLHHGVNGATDTLTATPSGGGFSTPVTLTAKK